MMRWFRRDDGVATLEMAFLLPILLMLSIVAVEFGFAFLDWTAVSNATRTGARVVSAAGDEPGSDVSVMIPAIVEAMSGAPRANIETIDVFYVNADGSQGAVSRYTEVSPGSWVCGPCVYPETNRNTTLSGVHTIGVRINFTHDWVVDFWSSSDAAWSDTEVIRIEPNLQGT